VKAFDNVERDKLFELLQSKSIPNLLLYYSSSINSSSGGGGASSSSSSSSITSGLV
jgi:hypothetical protein